MGRVVVGGGHSTLDDVLEREGIIDYTERFSDVDMSSGDDVFSSVLLQDKPVREFAEGFSQATAILNYGPEGVGKSMAGNALIRALRALDRGEEIHGPYAEIIKGRYDQLMSKPRGDILQLWNPDNYDASINCRTQRRAGERSVGTQLQEQTSTWLNELGTEGIMYTEKLAAQFEISRALTGRLRRFIKDNSINDYLDLKWTVSTVAKRGVKEYKVDVEDSELSAAWSTEINMMAEHFYNSYSRKTVMTVVEETLGDGVVSVLEPKPTISELKEEHKGRMKQIITDHALRLEEYRDYWLGKEEDISDWYGRVIRFLCIEKNQEGITESFFKKLTEKIPEDKEDLTGEEMHGVSARMSAESVDFINFRQEGYRKRLKDALEPEIEVSEETLRHLVIRRPTAWKESPLELLISHRVNPSVDKIDGNCSHHEIKLGDLAYADVVYLDDGIGETLSDKEFRVPMLTLLQDRRITVQYDQTQVDIDGCDFCLIANDADNPFERQKFGGTDPIFDGPMNRRFRVVKWPEFAKQSDDTIDSFPSIIRNMEEGYVGADVSFSPDAINLLYHMQIAGHEVDSLFPLRLGQLKDKNVIPLITRVHVDGRDMITAEDVRAYFMSKRDELQEFTNTCSAKAHVPIRGEYAVGQSNILGVGADDVGVAVHLSASANNLLGEVRSNEIHADFMDETFRKGVLDTRAWLQSAFPEAGVEVVLTHGGFSIGGGPSSGAANTYAVLSELGDVPIHQHTYITGTVQCPDGRVGAIGGVYGKSRAAWLAHKELYGDDVPMRVMVPSFNVEELLRKAKFDEKFTDAIDTGYIEICSHDKIWDGFERLSGLPRHEYEPRLRAAMRQKSRRAADQEWGQRHPILGRLLGKI